MSNVDRYNPAGAMTPHKTSPTGIFTRLQLSKAIDQAAKDKQIILVEAEKRAIVQQLESDLISQKIAQDARNLEGLQQYILTFLQNYVRGASSISATAEHAAQAAGPGAAEHIAAAEATALRLFEEHTAAGAAVLDPRNYRR